MPPKKDAAPPNTTIDGYDVKETRILAAAFVSSLGADKYDWPLFAKLAGFTEGSLKKFWPPVKNKAIEQHEGFATFLKGAAAATAATSKAAGGKKRKAADADADVDNDPKAPPTDVAEKAPEGKTKKAPAKKRGKKAKAEEPAEENVKEEVNSADGGDGLGEFVYRKNVVDWLESTDGTADEA